MSTQTRTYRKRRRAELEAETRQRITEATIRLHGEVGPVNTTVSAIAERAGVQRATVYRHFPDDTALIAACSAHWMSLNPAPDLAEWAAIDDPAARLRTALGQTYAWYERTETMIELLQRDRARVPALDERMKLRDGYFAAAVETLMRGRPERGARRRRARGAIGHALEFETWRSLVRRQGLARDEAIGLLAGLSSP
jgi:AcrR family transcriptional regulator